MWHDRSGCAWARCPRAGPITRLPRPPGFLQHTALVVSLPTGVRQGATPPQGTLHATCRADAATFWQERGRVAQCHAGKRAVPGPDRINPLVFGPFHAVTCDISQVSQE
jgi:hypothetical protein